MISNSFQKISKEAVIKLNFKIFKPSIRNGFSHKKEREYFYEVKKNNVESIHTI